MPRGLGSAISPGTTTFNGSIAVDKNGDVIINFNASGRSLPSGDYFVVHRRTGAQATDAVFCCPDLQQCRLVGCWRRRGSYSLG
jgi:hypothetical protein